MRTQTPLSRIYHDFTSKAGQVICVTSDETGLTLVDRTEIAESIDFIRLKDVPNDYTGNALKFLRVTSDETGMEFHIPTASDVLFSQYDDLTVENIQLAIQELQTGKATSSHTHSGNDVTTAVANATNADTLDGTHSSGFAASEHNHDSSYYTESEINSYLDLKSDLTYVDLQLSFKSDSTHAHDGLYPPISHFHAGSDITTAVSNATNADTLDSYHADHTTGTIPISDTTLNIDLNADMLDGTHASGFAASTHSHTNYQDTSAKGQSNGYASLDSLGKIPTGQLPGLALTDVYAVSDETSQLSLNEATQEGDVCIRSDLNKSYVRNDGTAGTMADWSELLTPTGSVVSVNGNTGVVNLTSEDITFIQSGDITSTTVQLAIEELNSEKANLSHIHAGSDITTAVASATNADTLDGTHASGFASNIHDHTEFLSIENDLDTIKFIDNQTLLDNAIDCTDIGIVVDNGANAYYPSLLFDDNAFETNTPYKFRCFYSTGTAIKLITSMDGTTQTSPVSATGLATAHHPTVVYNRSGFGTQGNIKYKIWYQNSSVSNLLISTIRYAESTDGTTWINDQAITQDSTHKLITGNSGDWNAGTWGFQKVFYNPNAINSGTDPFDYKYCAYYDCNTGTTYQTTGIAYSTNGINWFNDQTSPVLNRNSGDSSAQDYYTASFGSFLRDINGFHCWYSGGKATVNTDNYGIGYAHSIDGINQSKDSSNPIFCVSDGLTYRDERCYTPSVVDNGTGIIFMIYTAQGTAQTGRKKLALATLKYASIRGMVTLNTLKNDSSVSGTTLKDALNSLLSHDHDEIYATITHLHSGDDITSAVANATNADTLDGTHASGFAASDHNHDSDYATSSHVHTGSDITSAVANATNADTLDLYHAAHTTGAIPISDTTLNTDLNADMLDGHHSSYFAISDHNHDSSYYTESEIDSKLSLKSDSTHNHSGTYALLSHNHAGGDITTAVANATESDTLDGQHGNYYLDWTNFTNKPDSTITLTGSVTGSAVMNDLGNVSIDTTAIGGDHDHAIGDITNLQTELNKKADLTILQDVKEPTGFIDQSATLSFDNTTRTFTITGSHTFYNNAIKVTKDTTSVVIGTDVGMHYIYYNTSNVLTSSTSFPTMSVPLVAFVYQNGTKGNLSDERHGCSMDAVTHLYLHNTVGVRYESGLSGTFSDTTLTITAGYIQDEDLRVSISQQTTCDVYFKNGSATWDQNSNQTKYFHDNGTLVYYNNGNNLTTVPSNYYVAYQIFATNSVTKPIMSIMGQRIDTNIQNARDNNKYESLVLGEIPFKEMKLLYRVILRGDKVYQEVQDLRSISNIPTGTYLATDHDTLSNIRGGGTYHLSSSQYTSLTDGSDSTLHIHDSRYYTESEIDSKLSLKSDSTHNHSGTYATLSHVHAGGDITTAVANATNADTLDGTHSSGFAASEHNHSGTYATLSHLHAGSDVTTAVANATTSASCSGNAATATTLQTARTINGVSFNGSANILIPSIYDSNYKRITNPGGAEYTTQSSSVTGAIAITLPVGQTNSMMMMTIKIREHTTNESFELVCGGYNYSTTATQAAGPFAFIKGNPDIDRRFTVRFGYTSTNKCIIYIGDLTNLQSYPQIFVTDVQLGFSGQSANWVSGQSIDFEASAFQNITATVTASQIGYQSSSNVANSVVLRDSSGNFSAGTITATLTGTASNADTLDGTHSSGFAASGHNHDSSYYTETEINAKLELTDIGFKRGMKLFYKDTTSFTIYPGRLHISDGTTNKMCKIDNSMDITVDSIQSDAIYGVYATLPANSNDITTISYANIDSQPVIYMSNRMSYYKMIMGTIDDRCIGFFRTNSTADIVAFAQVIDEYLLIENGMLSPEISDQAEVYATKKYSSVDKTANYTMTDTDGYDSIFISGDTTITLPKAAIQRLIRFTKKDTGTTATIITYGPGDTIQGNTTITLNSQYSTVTLGSDGISLQVEF